MAARKRPTGPKAAPQAYNGAIRAQLGELQRARILRGALEVSCERGAGTVTVAHMVERSGVSRRTFYEQFSDREDCLLAVFEHTLAAATERVAGAYEGKSWRERVRGALIALLAFLDEQPLTGRFLVSESLACGPRTLARRGEVLARLTRAIDEGRSEAKGAAIPPLTAEGLAGGAISVIQSRIVEPGHAPLVRLTNELMSMLVLPYLGAGAARREMDRPLPKPVKPTAESQTDGLGADAFKAAGMRLTYRTVRVLVAVAEHPDGSNRLIGESAGITDQGQISKLLSRLERKGLIENTRRYPGKGAPNSWALTDTGRQVTGSVGTHAADLCAEGRPGETR
jgi:AcrR family transcriptional regulator